MLILRRLINRNTVGSGTRETPPLQDETALAAWLRSHGTPVEQWGAGDAKTIAHLLAELRGGDCWLTERDGTLIRNVRTVELTVSTRRAGVTLRLVEDHQRFPDGRVRRRPPTTSLAEKLKPNEDPTDGAIRALREELAITEPTTFRPLRRGPQTRTRTSPSYPGLRTRYVVHRLACELPGHLVREIHIEDEGNLTTVFTWKPDRLFWPNLALKAAAGVVNGTRQQLRDIPPRGWPATAYTRLLNHARRMLGKR
jgi:hypothetical protein